MGRIEQQRPAAFRGFKRLEWWIEFVLDVHDAYWLGTQAG
jgi:hypothetical protein